MTLWEVVVMKWHPYLSTESMVIMLLAAKWALDLSMLEGEDH